MKKKLTAILLTVALLAGCGAQAPAAPSAEPAPDIEEIIQQSVDEAVQEKLKEYEEEQKKKDQEIEDLKKQLEELTPPPEVPPTPGEDETAASPTSQPEETPSQPEIPAQPAPDPAPPQSSTSTYDPYDLKNMYPGIIWESPMEEAGETTYTAGCLLEEAEEVIRLTNQERENHGLEPLPIDEDLMELARIRAEETRTLYSHTRPDGTTVVDLRCGENGGRRSSAAEQVKSWMNSEGHRANILLERYHHIGAGCYQAENGNLYWTLIFSLD